MSWGKTSTSDPAVGIVDLRAHYRRLKEENERLRLRLAKAERAPA